MPNFSSLAGLEVAEKFVVVVGWRVVGYFALTGAKLKTSWGKAVIALCHKWTLSWFKKTSLNSPLYLHHLKLTIRRFKKIVFKPYIKH